MKKLLFILVLVLGTMTMFAQSFDMYKIRQNDVSWEDFDGVVTIDSIGASFIYTGIAVHTYIMPETYDIRIVGNHAVVSWDCVLTRDGESYETGWKITMEIYSAVEGRQLKPTTLFILEKDGKSTEFYTTKAVVEELSSASVDEEDSL